MSSTGENGCFLEREPLAKSGETIVTLRDHLEEVTRYVREVISAYIGWWEFLWGQQFAAELKKALIWAAITHDLGKAAEGFQRELRKRGRWDFRHEVLSASILFAGFQDDNEALRWAIAAVLTHHRELNDEKLRNDCGLLSVPLSEVVHQAKERFRHRAAELQHCWQWLRAFWKDHEELRHLPFPNHPGELSQPSFLLEYWSGPCSDASLKTKEWIALLLTRGWLMASDHAVSSGVKSFLSHIPQPEFPSLRSFQKELGNHTGHALLEAPTGSGKTYAALSWALRNRKGGERIFYLLPYQASIEAMAEVLQRLFGKELVATLHARTLDYAFRKHFEELEDYEKAIQKARAEDELNRLVHKPVKVTTPFQLLKWLFGFPRFEIGIGEMVGGLFIFDEIHAYDAHVAGLICEMVRFLKGFGGRFLFMSATFPPFLKRLFQEALGEEVAEYTLSTGTEDAWTHWFLNKARHRIRWHDAFLEDLLHAIIEAMHRGQRVLVVANRVAQAQEVYRCLREHFEDVYLLHSRFTHRDRTAKERAILGALHGQRPDVSIRALVATQVVEVSLDVSFDTIFTEVAPVDDLLQRFGRVNRYGKQGEGAEVHIACRFDSERLRRVYSEEVIKRTLGYAPKDGTLLTAAEACRWVQEVYRDGWTREEKERYDQVRQAFRIALSALCPLRHFGESEEEFYGLFKSVEVLPCGLYEEYEKYMRDGYYLIANQFFVPVPLGTFHMLRKAGLLVQLERGALMARVLYDRELGLLPQEVDIDAGFL